MTRCPAAWNARRALFPNFRRSLDAPTTATVFGTYQLSQSPAGMPATERRPECALEACSTCRIADACASGTRAAGVEIGRSDSAARSSQCVRVAAKLLERFLPPGTRRYEAALRAAPSTGQRRGGRLPPRRAGGGRPVGRTHLERIQVERDPITFRGEIVKPFNESLLPDARTRQLENACPCRLGQRRRHSPGRQLPRCSSESLAHGWPAPPVCTPSSP